jgi:acetyl-CoA C-acetyltransferase
MQQEVFIVAAARTIIGSFGGSLQSFSATQLGSLAIKGALQKINLQGNEVDEVVMGCVLQANIGQAPARQAAIFAGLPNSVVATTVNKVCASGLKAVMYAAQNIALQDAQVVVAGGMESMSNTPYYNPTQRWGNKYGNVTLVDGLAKDGLTDVYNNYAMGNAAELCATEMKFSREEQDAFAVQSYQRSQNAVAQGKFVNEITPITVTNKKGETTLLDKDEEPFNVKFDKIPTLKPAFTPTGTVTAANASTMNDGAAALILMSKEKMEALGLKPLAKIISYADAEHAPEWFTTAPTTAVEKALHKANLTTTDVDFYELNEAFSVVGLANCKNLNLDAAKVNVNGGAVSLGHPLGCSGARILVTLINVLKQNNGKYGVAAICNGGGGASAVVIENV